MSCAGLERLTGAAALEADGLLKLPLYSLPTSALQSAVDASAPEAGVLVGIFEHEGEACFLVTQRARGMRHHGGECAFPGGKRDPEDSDIVACTLREACEEVGLTVGREQVVCVCEPALSRFGLKVFPVVARLPDDVLAQLTLSAAEVAHAFPVPLRMLLRDGYHHWYRDMEFAGLPWRSHMFWVSHAGRDFGVWGLTAVIAMAVAALFLEAEPEYQVLHPQLVERPGASAEHGHRQQVHAEQAGGSPPAGGLLHATGSEPELAVVAAQDAPRPGSDPDPSKL